MSNAERQVESADLNEVNIEELFGEKSMRWYQIAAKNEVADHLAGGVKRIVVVLPTGAGKTLTNGSILVDPRIRKTLTNGEDRPLRVLFVAHKHRLLSQAEKAYSNQSGIVTVDDSNYKNSTMFRG